MTTWFYAAFRGEHLDLPYPAVRRAGVTYVFSPMSKLDELRKQIQQTPPPSPILPVVAIDCPMTDPPHNEWIGLSAKDCHWFKGPEKQEAHRLELDAFNETIELMTWLWIKNPGTQNESARPSLENASTKN